MKIKKVTAVAMAAAMAMSMAACGNDNSATTDTGASTTSEAKSDEPKELTYDAIRLGEDYTDIKTTIKVLTQRTDMLKDDYAGDNYADYVERFNKVYPNITVEFEGIDDYDKVAAERVKEGDWGDIMMIPSLEKEEYASYFLPYGDLTIMSSQIKFTDEYAYNNQVYGIPSKANVNGIVYNKKVFEEAGVTEIPKTPDEFIAALQKIKDSTDAVPLYTNYAAGWTLEQWEAHIGGTATGKAEYMNHVLGHTAAPFANPGDGTGPYNVYKILYDAVANGLTEKDYKTTDWEASKKMINDGDIGCMVLGSWAFSQVENAGPNHDDIGYMPFPITVNGKQYASAGADYGYAINAKSSDDNKAAAMVFVKWLTTESKYAYNEGGIPVALSDSEWPDIYEVFGSVQLVIDDKPLPEEAGLNDKLNADSGLKLNAGGGDKLKALVEAAASGSKSFDDIMADWNTKWSDAQKKNNIEQTY